MSLEEDAESSELSALRDNIARKGNNSYYYAHGHKVDGPVWDGNAEPRLLSVDASPPESTPTSVVAISEYSWLDEKKCVKIYVEWPGADALDDACISCSGQGDSFEFIVTTDKDYKLALASLNDSIAEATYKKKPSKFIISLVKAEERSWFSLKK